jgi:signal transduction histidine kinase/DNA-binding response OmpR family regulator
MIPAASGRPGPGDRRTNPPDRDHVLLNGVTPVSQFDLPAGESRAVGRVLVVDDTTVRRSAIASALRSEGFDVIEAASGKAAHEAAALHAPEAVVLDLSLPETQSFDVCRRLKDASATMLPVLYLSSRTSRAARARALDAGFDGYLVHPFDPNELCAAVGALIRLKRQEAKRVAAAALSAIDLTERHDATGERERLVASLEMDRSRLAAIFDLAPSFLAVLRGADYVFERINPAYRQLVGHRDPVGKPLLEALPEIRGQGFIELLDTVRITGEPFIGKQMAVRLSRTADSPIETRYVDLVYQRLVDAAGEFSVVAHGVDVTDQVLATEALRLSDQRLRDQFAKLPVPTYLWERSGDDFVLVDCNEAAVRSFPAFGRAAIGGLSRTLFPAMDDVSGEFARCLAENTVVRRIVELDAGRALGKRLLDLTIGPQLPDRVLVHAVDTTDRVELEGQLRQAQKMDAVGRLAGGVAHDFNNLLTVIGAHSSFLLETLDSDDARREDAEAIHKAGIRAAGLTRQLLAFSRKQILKPSVLDLNEVVEETQKMLARLLGEDIEIVTHLADDLSTVVADASQIDQVIVNLAVNARDAMPDGGVLTIATRNVTISDAAYGTRHRIPLGEYALLEVSDTGVGMDASVQARLFEPFFTTKGPGKGTGLGLATVYGVVKQSAGYVLVESAPAHGTVFRVFLPALAAESVTEELRVAEKMSVRGVETILLIEDEPAVREISNRILMRQGYVVLLAATGAQALEISSAFEATIHLVISDAVMPGMSGAEAVRRLQEQRPGLKALFMSGYTDDEILRRGIVSSKAAFIQKPFSLADFARAAREALDG